jgi:hypothetical protein
MKKGDRIKISSRITEGNGEMPKPGSLGTFVEHVAGDSSLVLVVLDDGRRALLASWEIELAGPAN